jgi:flagellar protein FliO/FliZ
MHRPSSRRVSAACGGTALACALALGLLGVRPVRAEDGASPELSIRSPLPESRHEFPPPASAGRRPSDSSRTPGAWWVGTAGIALALACFGAISMASRRLLPGRSPGPFEVMARASLSPKHTVHLLRAGDRTLIVGTGPQGPPALLGEWTGPVELRRAAPAARRRSAPVSTSPTLDEPIGDQS